MTRSKKATNLKDEVYGVNGLLGDAKLPEVNYNCKTRDIYVDIIVAAV
jgi:hypothetical protein